MLMQHGYGGEAVEVERRRRLTDDEVRRVRCRQMYVMSLQGQSSAEIAVFFNLSRKHIWSEIKSIPEPEKRRIEGRYHRGQVA